MVFMLTESKKAFIEFMMSADVLRFGSFVTKSGRNTPYFVNTGNYKTGEQIAKLGKFYASLIKETVGEDFSAMFGRRTRVFRLPQPPPRPSITSMASRSPTSSTARKRKTTAKAAASSATSRRTAIKLLSSKTSSPPAPPCARPCRSSTAAAM